MGGAAAVTQSDAWTGIATGRVWRFGDGVNTDAMYPGFAIRMPPAEAAQHMFSATRPGWPALVCPGDIVLAGSNMGLGSSRPVPALFQELGIACVVAVSFNGLFFRNCITFGLPAAVVEPTAQEIPEGSQVKVDLTESMLTDVDGRKTYSLRPLPDVVMNTLRRGGVFPQLEADGLLRINSRPAK
jgi:3-isopropylmalate/(R)-2-methylmalate dehydratase small subunit